MKVSFVIPTYNAAPHLETCLKSIREQSYPQEDVEVLALDGGSSDETRDIARAYHCQVVENPKKLAEYGVQLGMRKAKGDLLIVFAADNELVGKNWIKKVTDVFEKNHDVCAVWGRLASGENDPALNKYFELIQSDPLNWFMNDNLKRYKAHAELFGAECCLFDVLPQRPLVWGANGLVFRAEKIKPIWTQEGYLGDNDAFQHMIERGDNRVGYFDGPFVYHHHVARIGDWIKKWERNFTQHLVSKQKSRNMNWFFTKGYKRKVFLWGCYNGIPFFSLGHSVYLSLRDRNRYWLYHPFVSFIQFLTCIYLALFFKKGRSFIKRMAFEEK